jgi:hypothetical protein
VKWEEFTAVKAWIDEIGAKTSIREVRQEVDDIIRGGTESSR